MCDLIVFVNYPVAAADPVLDPRWPTLLGLICTESIGDMYDPLVPLDLLLNLYHTA